MTRKELERLLAEAASLADRLTEPLESLSSDELDVALARPVQTPGSSGLASMSAYAPWSPV